MCVCVCVRACVCVCVWCVCGGGKCGLHILCFSVGYVWCASMQHFCVRPVCSVRVVQHLVIMTYDRLPQEDTFCLSEVIPGNCQDCVTS